MANGWGKYQELVLHELEDHGKRLEEIIRVVSELREDVAGIKAKSTIMGGAAGIVGTAVMSAVIHLWK